MKNAHTGLQWVVKVIVILGGCFMFMTATISLIAIRTEDVVRGWEEKSNLAGLLLGWIDSSVPEWRLWALGLFGLLLVVVGLLPWQRMIYGVSSSSSGGSLQKQGKGRTMVEKYRARETWRRCVDSLIAEGNAIGSKGEHLGWVKRVLDSFDNRLTDPTVRKAEFQERVVGIDKQGQVSIEAVQRGLELIEAMRDTLTEHELR